MSLRSSLILILGGLALLGYDDPAPTSIAGGAVDGGSPLDGSGGVMAPDADVVPVGGTPSDASPPSPVEPDPATPTLTPVSRTRTLPSYG